MKNHFKLLKNLCKKELSFINIKVIVKMINGGKKS